MGPILTKNHSSRSPHGAVVYGVQCILCVAGESVPVTKTPIAEHRQVASDDGSSVSAADLTFRIKEHSRHVLFCGTHVIQTRYYGKHRVKAVVIRTGLCD